MRDKQPNEVNISFIIPMYNRLALTKDCLASLEETVREVTYEVILVDDTSTDGTREFARELKSSYRVIFNDENLGYAASNNLAARSARAPVLCLLNNDTVLSQGWLEPMVALLNGSREIGLVGNIQINMRTGLIDHAGVFFDLNGHPEHAHKGRKKIPKGPYSERNAVSAACWLIRRETFLSFGGFDETFKNGYEDVDLCVQMRLAGYRLLVSHDSVIFHYVASSPNRAAHDRVNKELFLQRWSNITSGWGRQEWPVEYLRRYARRWWRYRLSKVMLALWLMARDQRISKDAM